MMMGKLGTATTLTTMVAGLATTVMPVLQVLSLAVSIVVGVLTAIWWIQKLRKEK